MCEERQTAGKWERIQREEFGMQRERERGGRKREQRRAV